MYNKLKKKNFFSLECVRCVRMRARGVGRKFWGNFLKRSRIFLTLTTRNPRSSPKTASGITMDDAMKQATAAGLASVDCICTTWDILWKKR